MYPTSLDSKSWKAMTEEEKIESLKAQLEDYRSRVARENSLLHSEVSFLRRLLAMKFGLDEKQIVQLFNFPHPVGGLTMGSY